MNERFIRCEHCGQPHEESCRICPKTGKPVEGRSSRSLGATRNNPLATPPPGSVVGRRAPPRPPVPPDPSSSSITTSPGAVRRDLIGRTIGGKYNIRAVLGEGGMGTVFEALNLSIGRQVAVKVLHANQLRKKDSVRRFHQEARAAGAIGHPNICEVYDLGTLEDGCPYLVMEKLVGETLADRIGEEGGLPVEEVVDTLTQVLSGLVAAHEKGIVHRDIKPENVFLTKRVGCAPVAKLLDFGVSKMISMPAADDDSEPEMTRTGIVLGTPYYLAPEQARGERALDARVDLYACGVLLYEALTGRRPFTGQNYNALLINILTGKPRPAREVRPALPRGFDRILDKAMAREPSDRYQTAVEFQNDLQRLAARIFGGSMPASMPNVRREVAITPSTIPTGGPLLPEGKELRRMRTTGRRAAKRSMSSSSLDIPVDFTVPPPDPPRAPPPSQRPPPASQRLPAPPQRLPPPSHRPPPPSQRLPPPPASHSARRVDHDFDDMPTEIQPPLNLGGMHAPAQERMAQSADLRRAVSGARRPSGRPSVPRFNDESKTDVMNEDVKAALAKASERPPPSRR